MKRISVILIIGLFLVACGEQTEQLMPLDKGAPNTVKLSNGEVVYKMDGKWDAVIDWPHSNPIEDIIEIKQEDNRIVGVLLKGNEIKGTGDEIIKGELEKNGFISLNVNSPDGWLTAKSKIDSDCNKITTKAKTERGLKFTLTLTRK